MDAIVNIATLTGACLRTFGEGVAGLMSNNDDVAAQVSAAGDAVDEPVWRLPLIKSLRSDLDSDIADLKNLGGINAGSITAGLFLQEFVGDTPWAHLDVAGPAYNDKAAWGFTPRGGTGAGVSTLLAFLEATTSGSV